MKRKTKEAIQDNSFIRECNAFTCEVKKDMGHRVEVIPEQIKENLSTLDKTIKMIDIPIIGWIAIWFAKHSN